MQQLQRTMSEKKPGMDKERENTNKIEMGCRARAKTYSHRKKALVIELSPKERRKRAEGSHDTRKKRTRKKKRKK